MQKAYRLTNNGSFTYVYRKGQAVVGKLMVLSFVKAYSTRVGVSVSKKIGKSVQRNLVKRRIYENFAKLIPAVKGNYNYVVVARDGIAEASFSEIGDTIVTLLKKVGHID